MICYFAEGMIMFLHSQYDKLNQIMFAYKVFKGLFGPRHKLYEFIY
jgi:hypothetical protein